MIFCEACNGTGKRSDVDCDKCKGYGAVSDGLMTHNEMKYWAIQEHLKGNYSKERRIRKVACAIQKRNLAYRRGAI